LVHWYVYTGDRRTGRSAIFVLPFKNFPFVQNVVKYLKYFSLDEESFDLVMM
jgi:hypothetical protein